MLQHTRICSGEISPVLKPAAYVTNSVISRRRGKTKLKQKWLDRDEKETFDGLDSCSSETSKDDQQIGEKPRRSLTRALKSLRPCMLFNGCQPNSSRPS